jgi:hypothetical protein
MLMSMYRLVAGLVGLALVAAVVAVGVGVGTEVKAESAPTAIENNSWACAPEPWPYGCQWRTPAPKRVIIRGSRPS